MSEIRIVPGSTTETTNKNSNQNNSTLDQDDQEDLRCGYGSCKPAWLQVFNNPKAFLAWLCLFSFIQGFVVNGINNVNTTAIERRFDIPSTKVGLISSAYDFSAAVLAIPIAFLGTYGHQPRMLTISALVMAVGSFVMTLPHFTTDIYKLGAKEAETCQKSDNTTVCEDDSSLENYLYVLIFGQILHGVGGQTVYCLGYVFIDANVRTRSSPIYQGIMSAFSTFGPAMGYILGGVFLDIYTDFNEVDVDSLNIDPEDPRWVGAWWLGFLSGGCVALLVVVVLMPYARMLPAGRLIQNERVSECHQNGSEDIAAKENFGKSIKDLPAVFCLFARNPAFVFTTMGAVTEAIMISGSATFFPKYVQNQFVLTASTAALTTGLLTVPGAAGGMLFGGFLCRILKLKVRGMLRLCSLLTGLTAFASLIFLLKCTEIPFAGITVPYNYEGDSEPSTLDTVDPISACNEDCSCSLDSYTPVCGVNNVQYFSACHAGCVDILKNSEDINIYFNCSCITRDSTLSQDTPDAEEGVCELDCNVIKAMYPFIFLIIFLTFSASVPSLNATMRCVPDNMRALALGVQWTVLRFLGSVPGPILYGHSFDQACIVWREKCDSRGACWIYDAEDLNKNLVLLGTLVKVFSTIFFFTASFTHKPPEEEKSVEATKANNNLTLSMETDTPNVYTNKAMSSDEDTTPNNIIDKETHL